MLSSILDITVNQQILVNYDVTVVIIRRKAPFLHIKLIFKEWGYRNRHLAPASNTITSVSGNNGVPALAITNVKWNLADDEV